MSRTANEQIDAAEFRRRYAGAAVPATSPAKQKKHKYNVAPKAERQIGERTYASKAEKKYAELLAFDMEHGDVLDVVEQPRVQLGEDTVYRPDFLVIVRQAPGIIAAPYYVDVKGAETREFKRIKKLWRKYGRLSLVIVKQRGERFEVVETIQPD